MIRNTNLSSIEKNATIQTGPLNTTPRFQNRINPDYDDAALRPKKADTSLKLSSGRRDNYKSQPSTTWKKIHKYSEERILELSWHSSSSRTRRPVHECADDRTSVHSTLVRNIIRPFIIYLFANRGKWESGKPTAGKFRVDNWTLSPMYR